MTRPGKASHSTHQAPSRRADRRISTLTPFRLTVAAGLLWSLAAVCIAQQPVPLGDEFQVTVDSSAVDDAAVAADAAGRFVVVWQAGQDGDELGIFARRYDAAGAPQGPPFQVNTYTTDVQSAPAVAMNASGDFVVVWQSRGQDGGGYGVFGQRYDAAGAPLGSEFPVSAATYWHQHSPAIGQAGDGTFVVVWDGYTQAGAYHGIYGRRFDSLGNALGGDFPIRSTPGLSSRPALAMNAAGEFVVAWTHCCTAPRARRFDATGSPLGADFLVDSAPYASVRPAVGIDAGGAFVIAWNLGISGYGILARTFDGTGTPGAVFAVHSQTTGRKETPSVAMSAAGDFTVAWNWFELGAFQEIAGRSFDAAGNPRGPEFVVNAYTTGFQLDPAVAATPDGFVVAWTTVPGVGSSVSHVFARRWAVPPDLIFADGFETGALTAWSASQTDGGDLSVSASAAMASTAFGLEAVVDDQAGLFVQDDTPSAESRYRARFYLDPTGYDPGEASGHRRTHVFLAFADAPLRRLVQVILRRLDGQYALGARVRTDDDTLADTGFTSITSAPHMVELDWRRASAAGANDGAFELWIDGTSAGTLTGLDNDARSIDFARLGTMTVKAGAAGTLRFDEFESRRSTYIGPP